MKALAVSFLFSFFTIFSFGQNLQPVSWNFNTNKLEDGSYEFIATAKIKGDWAIYSQHTGKGGPVALKFSYADGIDLIGETKENSDPIKKMSALFEVEVIKFKKEAVFIQKFRPKEGVLAIKGSLKYMCCDDLRCLPPTEVAFDVTI